ncbi:hypothetical protein DITRI_Ditri11bG0110100 [Diplodiscus trichospermus]
MRRVGRTADSLKLSGRQTWQQSCLRGHHPRNHVFSGTLCSQRGLFRVQGIRPYNSQWAFSSSSFLSLLFMHVVQEQVCASLLMKKPATAFMREIVLKSVQITIKCVNYCVNLMYLHQSSQFDTKGVTANCTMTLDGITVPLAKPKEQNQWVQFIVQ